MHRLPATDPPLGMTSAAPHQSARAWNKQTDTLVLFTDGVCDARDIEGRTLGEAKVLEVVKARRKERPERIVDGVFALLEGHMGSVAPPDDQALLVLRT